MSKTFKIILVRDSGWTDFFIKYKVIINGLVVSKIANGETIEILVSQNNCEMYLKNTYMRSNSVQFNLSNNDSLEFFCRSNFRGWRIFLAGYYCFFEPDKWIILEQVK